MNDKWVASDDTLSDFSFYSGNTPTAEKSISVLQSEGWITANNVLAPEHDAAHCHWGGDWRMPTEQEFEDLNIRCDSIWATMNGVNGYVVRGRGDYASNSIFLPCAGIGNSSYHQYAGLYGYYFSSVPTSVIYNSWGLYFSSRYFNKEDITRSCGHPVRPVQGFTK